MYPQGDRLQRYTSSGKHTHEPTFASSKISLSELPLVLIFMPVLFVGDSNTTYTTYIVLFPLRVTSYDRNRWASPQTITLIYPVDRFSRTHQISQETKKNEEWEGREKTLLTNTLWLLWLLWLLWMTILSYPILSYSWLLLSCLRRLPDITDDTEDESGIQLTDVWEWGQRGQSPWDSSEQGLWPLVLSSGERR